MALLRLLGIAALCAAGCTRANPDYCNEQQPCAGDRVCDLAGVQGKTNACVAPLCEPGEVIECRVTEASVCADNQLEATVEQCEFGCTPAIGCVPCPAGGKACRAKNDSFEVAVCAGDGSVIDQRECVLGCADDEVCMDIDPANDLAMDLDFIDDNLTAVGDLALEDGAVIDGVAGTITDARGQPVEGFSVRQRQQSDNAPDMTVFRVRSLSIAGEVTVVGADVVAFAAIGDIVIDGTLIVRSGAIDEGENCVGVLGGTAPPDAGGSGGGGYRNDGGGGGSGGNAPGSQGGQSFGSSSLEPLSGGCSGGGALGGAGGGGLQLSSRTRVLVNAGAGINAGGQGGDTPAAIAGNLQPVGGGGSGGGLLLEAPIVMVDATGFVAANGGGGGCATRAMSVAGANGGLSEQQAPGADCSGNSNAADGGDGGSRSAAADSGQSQPNSGIEDAGGGGGGSIGRIRVNTVLVSPGDIRFSPDPSLSSLDTR